MHARHIHSSITVPRWEDACREKLAAADYQLQQSRQLRAADADTVIRGQNELASRHASVQFAARRRQHELQQAHDELRWQRGQVIRVITDWSDSSNGMAKYQATRQLLGS